MHTCLKLQCSCTCYSEIDFSANVEDGSNHWILHVKKWAEGCLGVEEQRKVWKNPHHVKAANFTEWRVCILIITIVIVKEVPQCWPAGAVISTSWWGWHSLAPLNRSLRQVKLVLHLSSETPSRLLYLDDIAVCNTGKRLEKDNGCQYSSLHRSKNEWGLACHVVEMIQR